KRTVARTRSRSTTSHSLRSQSPRRNRSISATICPGFQTDVVPALQLDELGAWDALGEVFAGVDHRAVIAAAMQHQRWHADRRQDVTDVELGIHPAELVHRAEI